MFGHLGKAYKDSDYTVIIASVHWHFCMCKSLPSWWSWSSCWPPLLIG